MTFQTSIELPRSQETDLAVRNLAEAEVSSDHGAVFTRSEIVSAILDLSGYTPDRDLTARRLLEPSFGSGEFLLAAVRRLLESCRRCGSSLAVSNLEPCILGVEIHRPTFLATKDSLIALLQNEGIDQMAAHRLARSWLRNDDFLLAEISGKFDFVVGNPPYIRQERIPNSLLDEYRRRFSTFYDRADLYVAFFERGLDLLKQNGSLSFICSNRWMKNRYGGPLRAKVSGCFRLKYLIDTEQADAFHSQVNAYSAITVIEKADTGPTTLALESREDTEHVARVVGEIVSKTPASDAQFTISVHGVVNGRAPWLVDSPEILHIVRLIESSYPTLEGAQVRVGIGVATGCDRVFIDAYEQIPVEEERKLPLLLAKDIDSTTTTWKGKGVLNPYEADGRLADLGDYPRFAEFVRAHQDLLKRRHVARKQPDSWYKTIDRIYPELVAKEKLLIPDIKGYAMVALDEGSAYPHHNLYVVTSDSWPLRPLQAILRSSIALMFVAAYCTRMSGGFLRFQAQYLRRIRIPAWKAIPTKLRSLLETVAEESSQEVIDSVVSRVFQLSTTSQRTVDEFARDARVLARPRS